MLRTQIGDYNRALEDYDKVALYSPNNVLVYYNRAGVYAQLGETKKPIETILGHQALSRLRQRLYLPRPPARAAARPAGRQERPRHGAEEDRGVPLMPERQHLFDIRRYDAALRPPVVIRQQILGRQLRPRDGPQRRTRRDAPAAAIQVHADAPRHRAGREALPRAARRRLQKRVDNEFLTLSWRESNIAPDTLVMLDKQYVEELKRRKPRGRCSSSAVSRRRSSSSTPMP